MHRRKIQIKVCGITDVSEILALNELEVDYAGFIFAKSPRQVSWKKAVELANAADKKLKIVGVFSDVDPEFINGLHSDGIIDIVQLHTQDLSRVREINAMVWASVPVSGVGGILEEVNPFIAGVHLDTFDKKLKGGTGRTFNWEAAGGFETDKILILAGGLSYENVREALGYIKADVVDLNSGAEIIRDGIRNKEPKLIRKFIEEVREYEKHE